MSLNSTAKQSLEDALFVKGLRSTKQREIIYEAVLNSEDHPSADLIYSRVKEDMPGISLATVYNCLETLTDCGLIRQVNFERQPSRFCLATAQSAHHAHAHCKNTGKVFDVVLPAQFFDELNKYLPADFQLEKVDLCLSGKQSLSQKN